MSKVIYERTVTDQAVHRALQRIADYFGATVTVHSGDRNHVPPGGSTTSLHLHGRAADFHVAGHSDASVFEEVKKQLSTIFESHIAYELIRHGQYTATGGPHLHLGHENGSGGTVEFLVEGLTPKTNNVYTGPTLRVGKGGKPLVPAHRHVAAPGHAGIAGSVGLGGTNQTADAHLVQHLLNRASQRLHAAGTRFESWPLLREDGIVGPKTLAAIEKFQRSVMGREHPDGRVDPGGATMRALNELTRGPVASVPGRLTLHQGKKPVPTPGKASAQSLSAAGLELIKQFESFRAQPYNDQGGHCTVGYGHLLHFGACTTADKAVTEATARAMLNHDAGDAVKAVNDLVKTPLNQNQFDALVSLTFNIGRAGFSTSTLLRELNAGRPQKAAAEFPRWNHTGGKVSEGLSRRRREEAALFEK